MFPIKIKGFYVHYSKTLLLEKRRYLGLWPYLKPVLNLIFPPWSWRVIDAITGGQLTQQDPFLIYFYSLRYVFGMYYSRYASGACML